MKLNDIFERIAAAVVILVCAGLIGWGFHWLLQNVMLFLPMHLHVFGVMVVGFGYLILVAFAGSALAFALEVLIGK